MNQLDQRLAQELHRRKKENTIKEKQVEKVIQESEEIRALQEKIRQAYTNKERAAQVAEKQTRRLNDLREEAEMDEFLVKQKEREIRELKEREQKLIQERLRQKHVLQQQIGFKEKLKEEAQQQFVKEKDEVDKVVFNIIQEDQTYGSLTKVSSWWLLRKRKRPSRPW
jgi:hypothetical protein